MRCCTLVSPGGQCTIESYYVVVYGCIDQHIRERPLCKTHAGEWLARFDARKWRCREPCEEKIIEMIIINADELQTEWLNI